MRLFGITIPDNKRLDYGLTVLYGVGLSRARDVLEEVGLEYTAKPTEVTTDQENKIRLILEGFTLEGDLKREISYNIKRLKDISAYRGYRHAKNLPCRGQRTKTNSRTVRGNKRVSMGSGRIKLQKT